jgi:hypothetical protein
MAEFVFTSPGVKFKERDLTFVTRNVGITTLGLVGETLKGPAFEPVFIQDKTQFAQRFGSQSTKRFLNGQLQYQLPYVANSYLEESNQLYVTRVLGLSGYDAGKSWVLTLSAGVDPTTTGQTSGATFTAIFTGNTYLGVSLYSVGDTGVWFTGLTKTPSTTDFTGIKWTFVAISMTGSSGTVRVTPWSITGTSYIDYEDMVLAVIRSRAIVRDNVNAPPTTIFSASNVVLTGNSTTTDTGDLFGLFQLAATPTNTGITTQFYTASLNPLSSSFLPNVIGFEPKDKSTLIWVESIYPDLIKKLDADGLGYGINTLVLCQNGIISSGYSVQFKTPETPWVVSQIKGSEVDRLFKFISISDGNAANEEIKISIQNIKPDTLEFDVVVRSFYDTDDNPNVLETFSRCTMIKGTTSYVAQRIGTSDGEYTLQSRYIMLELAGDNIPDDVFPAGFEGFLFTNYVGFGLETPKIFYKTSYNSDEKIKKVYLGVSEKAYDANYLAGTGINQNFFNFKGNGPATGFTKTNGFHMDKYATGVTSNGYSFDCGAGKFQTVFDIVDPSQTYYLLSTRKFTLVPSGGFDGWNVNRIERSYGDNFRQGGIYDGNPTSQPNQPVLNDFQAWETAIHTYDNPEEVTINLFATPGINWSDNTVMVQDTVEMMETQRTDTLYVIDSPDIGLPQIVGEARQDVINANDVVDLLAGTEIDSNYACTYFPWIQMRDTQNNVNVYIPPTGEVVKAMAFTDNTSFPWFAPAGLQRGVTNALKSKYKLSLDARDILYANRINPMADFADAGTAIFGQKTLQVKESALNRINVRRLLLQIKVLIANIAIRLVFEQNDQATIDQFLQKATPILDTIKRERGLQEFRIKMDDSNNTPETRDRNELYGEIFLKPTRAVEFIGITFTITPSGASFADVGA